MPTSHRRYDLLRSRLDRFMRTLPGIESGDVRSIHRARVASRRLRELLPVLQLDAHTTRKLTRRLREVTQSLGPVRELDVLVLLIDELHDSGRHDRRALRRVAELVRSQRHSAQDGATGKLAARLHRLVHKLQKVADQLTETDGTAQSRAWRWALEARVARRAAGLKAAIADAGSVYLPERLHAVRIALKKLRYGAELADQARGQRGSPEVAALKRLQTLLGRMHDLQVLTARARQAQAGLRPEDFVTSRQLDALVMSLERSCRRLHARYVGEREALVGICDRLGAKSSAGRGAARTSPGHRARSGGDALEATARRAG